MRHADEHPAAVRLLADGRVLPALRHALEHRPGKAPEIVLPFFGAAGAGKTRLLFSMVAQLRLWYEAGPAQRRIRGFRSPPASSTAEYILRPGSATQDPMRLPRAYIIRRAGPDPRKPGDAGSCTCSTRRVSSSTPRTHAGSAVPDKATTFILVIDPLSVEAFWDRLPPEQQAALEAVRSTAPSPDLAYQQAHQEIEAMGVQLRKVPGSPSSSAGPT